MAKEGVEFRMKQHFCSVLIAQVVCLSVYYKNLCSKLPVVALAFICALTVHPVSERISLQVFQVKKKKSGITKVRRGVNSEAVLFGNVKPQC